jgi:transcriptional regulator with XRE-family HTH domain
MPTPEEMAERRARQAWWLRVVRMTDPRKPTLSQVAVAAGLKPGSGSVVSLWERDDSKEGPKQSQLVRLAAYYEVPLALFTEPRETDEEYVSRLRRLAVAAIDLAHEDRAAERGGAPVDGGGHDERRGRRPPRTRRRSPRARPGQ